MSKLFGVIIKGQTYVNIFYLLIAFVLGILYFTLETTFISLGFGLLITLLGIPILIGTIALSRLIGKFEISMSNLFLKTDIEYPKQIKEENFWKRIKAIFTDNFTWKSLAHIFLKFPLGIMSFTITITLLSTSIALIASPVIFHLNKIGRISGDYKFGQYTVDSYWSVILIALLGVILLFGSLHLFNALGLMFKALNKTLLSSENNTEIEK